MSSFLAPITLFLCLILTTGISSRNYHLIRWSSPNVNWNFKEYTSSQPSAGPQSNQHATRSGNHDHSQSNHYRIKRIGTQQPSHADTPDRRNRRIESFHDFLDRYRRGIRICSTCHECRVRVIAFLFGGEQQDAAGVFTMDRQNQSSLCLKRASAVGAIMLMAGSLGFVSVATASEEAQTDNESSTQSQDSMPTTLLLDCVIRDFRPYNNCAPGGHPDFQTFSGSTTVGLVEEYLGDDGKPVSTGNLRGERIQSEFKDSEGRNIQPSSYDPEKGDIAGQLSAGSSSNGFYSVESFNQWYRDVPGVNLSKSIQLTLNRVRGTDRYVFDSDTDTEHGTGGFFPINDDLFGDYRIDRNYHFSTEINTQFTFHRETGQVFKFTGDDDVWVFIDGRLVVDLGGLHARREQFLDVDRLDWLEDGRTYTLDIFHAERRYSGSNFRIETTLQLRSVELPPTAALYD